MLLCNVLTLAWYQLQDRGTTISDSRIQALNDFSSHLREEESRQSLVFALEAPSAQVHTRGHAYDLHLISRLTLLWAAALGMKLNGKKSLAFEAAKLYVGEVDLTVVSKSEILGHMLHLDAQLAETTVMPVLYGLETAQFAYDTLRELVYDVWQAVRAGRSCSRVEAIEALLTICARGHQIDPVQYLAYRTVKTWIRWLRQPHLDQDSERLQRSWLRMHDFEYPAGTSSGGPIAPLPVGSDSVDGHPGQHWVEVDCTIQIVCRWHSVRSS